MAIVRIYTPDDRFSTVGKTSERIINSCLLLLHLVNCMHAALLLTVCDLFIQAFVDQTPCDELFNGWVQSYFIRGSGLLLFVLLVCVFFRSI